MTPTPIFLTTAARCPTCGAVLNGTAAMDAPDEPRPGDLTVCLPCGALLMFVMWRGQLQVRALTVPERLALQADAAAWALIQQALKERTDGRWRARLPGAQGPRP